MDLGDILVTRWEQIAPRHHVHGGKYEYYQYPVVKPEPGANCRVSVYRLPPRKASYPYHWHMHNEEIFYIMSGEGVLRTPQGERLVRAGEFLVFPPCENGAHQIVNASDTEDLIYLDMDTLHRPDVCHYPDSGKIGVYDSGMGKIFLADSEVDYYEGE